MKKLTVALAGNEYDILIGDGIMKELGGLLKPFRAGQSKIAVVTDENVWAAHGETFSSAVGGGFEPVIMPPGEGSKSMDGLARLYERFAGMNLTRGGLAVAFGGGVAGDLCGFAAATWMRGVRFAQVPTTLLAQVDSSVGGKTAINIPQGKNLAGAFHQPSLVVIDPETLRTLPEREMRSGMSEVIKYGAIRSLPLFGALAESAAPDLPGIIHECCRVKAGITARDERDQGERALLNFGHTFGHAIEKISGFETYRHGEAVAFGMVMAAEAGERLGITEPGAADSIRRVLAGHGLETEYPGRARDLLPVMSLDKKSGDGWVNMVFLRRVGEAFTRRTEFSELEAVMGAAL